MRHTGLLLPLFSAASSHSWGIGELPDVAALAAWAARCGCDRLMILPIGTMAAGHHSPYSALSAMAIDPIFIAVERVPDFSQAGGTSTLGARMRSELETARAAAAVDYERVRSLKREALNRAFDYFVRQEWEQHTTRASTLARYIARERWWLDDYALFQVLSAGHAGATWREWPAPLRDRDPAALDSVRRQHAREILQHQYLQWVAEGQWQSARATAEGEGIAIFGDVPFVVNLHSADVWTRPDEFMLDVTVGTPPDAFSETGQDWGLPAYRWDVEAARDYPWIRQRARRMAALFSGLRLDHVIGFYRTYNRPPDGEPFFMPDEEQAQLRQGEAVVGIFKSTGALLIAEDLGTLPPFLRPSLDRLRVPGCKVLRWEREWDGPGQPFIEPATFPSVSCVMTGTHDTETLPDWWDHAGVEERSQLLRLPALAGRGFDPAQPWDDALRDALLELAWTSGSDDLFAGVQDIFGWRDRINIPATVGDHNWRYRLPWPVDRLTDTPEAIDRAEFLQALTGKLRAR